MKETTTYYTWKEPRQIDGEERLLTPYSDPMVHEFPFDFVFDTPEEAIASLREQTEPQDALDEVRHWVLCLVTTKPITTFELGLPGWDDLLTGTD